MENNPLVSVITPCHNDGRYILETVESVRQSSYAPIEHIIVDDGSTDPYTHRVLDQIANSSYATVIRTENLGVSSARNTAITHSQGKYILPIDGDDKISAEYIRLAVQRLEADPQVKVVAVNYKYFGRHELTIDIEPYSMNALLGYTIFTISSMFRRKDFDQTGGFCTNMVDGYEDWDFWLKLLGGGGKVTYLDGYHFFYRIKDHVSRSGQITPEKHDRLRFQIWENNKALYAEYFPDPYASTEYRSMLNSREYKVGKQIVRIVRTLMFWKR